jgi:hypothetical protein
MSFLSHLPRSLSLKLPVESVSGARRSTLPEVARVVAIATLAALLLGSRALLDWSAELPVSALSDALLGAAETWHGLMEGLGLNRLGDGIRAAFRSLQRF